MNITINVNINIMREECNKCTSQRQSLLDFMRRVNDLMRVLSAVAWISPASRALWAKFQLLYRQIEEALRIVEDYIQKLDFAMQQYGDVDRRLEEKVGTLKTDIFGV